MERRLAAILAADVVGYTALMGADEADTFRRLTELREAILEPLITQHHGRLFKLMGDGLMVEFSSVVDAVSAAMAWQTRVVEHQSGVAENLLLRFRIGINLGDVIVEGDDIHGDGVNVAARLEGLAEPGGICLSDDAYRQVRGKVEAAFVDLGEQALKNIVDPVKVYRIGKSDGGTDAASLARRPLSLPDKPSIAVLPFNNLSRDPEQELFCDGITEDLITALSKIKRLLVVARSSTFVYKGRAVDIRQVGREQGVRFVLEGSVRRLGNRVRVTAQLIDAETGLHSFGERYDRNLTDIFVVQDEITREIAAALQIELTDGEQAGLWASGTQNLEAWELCIRAAELIDNHVREDTKKGRMLLERALKIDPDYATAWCKIGWAHWSDGRHHWTRDVRGSYAKAREAAERAQELDPDAAEPFSLMAMTALQEGDYDEASELADQATERAAGQSFVLAITAMALSHCGRATEAISLARQAMRLCPIYPNWYRVTLGRSYYLAGDFDRAIEELRAWHDKGRGAVNPVLLAAAYFDSGRTQEAQEICQNMIADDPGFSISEWEKDQAYKDQEILAHLVEILERAGVPH